MKTSEFNKLPYLSHKPNDGRQIPIRIAHFAEENRFSGFIPLSDQLLPIKLEPVEGAFRSLTILQPETDRIFSILEVLENHFSFPKISKWTEALQADHFNFASFLRKQVLLQRARVLDPEYADLSDIHRLELEYLTGLVRAFYDLIYSVLCELYGHYGLYSQLQIKKLPKTLGTFADAEDLSLLYTKYKFNEPLKAYFNSILPLLRVCRAVRDSIYHHGADIRLIFNTERGPAISLEQWPFLPFKDFFFVGPESQAALSSDNLASLFYFEVKLIYSTLKAADDFAIILQQAFKLLPSISEKYHLILRSPHMKYVNNLPQYMIRPWPDQHLE